jgi:uncharacterized protein YjbI with pentapeptide repeats
MKYRPARSILCCVALVAALGAVVGISSAQASWFPNCSAHPAPGVNWSFCDKHNQRIGPADMTGATLNSTNFAHSDFERTTLVGVTALLGRFHGAKFIGASLRGSDFAFAHFSEANFRQSHADFVDDSKTEWLDANLSRATFEGINLSHADFSRADLTATSFVDVNLDRANLYRAKFDGGYLYGVTLRHASLQHAHMVDINVFKYGNIERVDFTGANLKDAVIQVAGDRWKYIHFSDTTCPDGTNSDHDAGNTCRGHGFR